MNQRKSMSGGHQVPTDTEVSAAMAEHAKNRHQAAVRDTERLVTRSGMATRRCPPNNPFDSLDQALSGDRR